MMHAREPGQRRGGVCYTAVLSGFRLHEALVVRPHFGNSVRKYLSVYLRLVNNVKGDMRVQISWGRGLV